MSVDSAAMLRQLGQAGHASATRGAAAPAQGGVQSGEFADLLRRARDGTVSSNRPVSIEDGSGVKLSEDQLARLSLAADRAEAAGLRHALVMIDDQKVILDVQQRKIVGQASTASGVLDNIDGVIDLAGALSPVESKPAPVGPPTALDNPAVARLMSQSNQRGRAA